MKRNVILATLFAFIAFTACKKDKDIVSNPPPAVKQDPTLKKDTTYPNKTLIVPKMDTVIGSYVLDTKDAQGMTAISSSVKFTFTGAFKPSDDLRNVYFVVKDASTDVFTSEKKLTVNDAVNSFTQSAFLSFTQAKVYVVEIHADVLSSATDNTGIDDKCTVTFDLIYQANGSATNKTLSATGQTLTFALTASSTVQISQVTGPQGQAILGSQEFELSKVDMLSSGGTSILTQTRFSVGGDPGLVAAISAVRVYDGMTLIGSASVVPGVLATATVGLNLNLPQGMIKTLSVKVVIAPINSASASSPSYSGITFDIGVVDFTYTDAGAVVKTGTYGTAISSKFMLLKSMQTVTSVTLPGNLQNGIVADVYKFNVTSNPAGPTANKQFTFEVTLTDNGVNLDTLSLTTLSLKINGVTATNVRFTNSAGQVTDTIRASDPKVHVTFISGTPELITLAGATTSVVLSGKFRGFNHPGDGDVASIKLIATDNQVPSSGYRYINSGVTPNNLNAKSWTSPTANAGAVIQNYPWSDMSDPAHSFAFGAGTADAKNASIGVIANISPQVWLQ